MSLSETCFRVADWCAENGRRLVGDKPYAPSRLTEWAWVVERTAKSLELYYLCLQSDSERLRALARPHVDAAMTRVLEAYDRIQGKLDDTAGRWA